MTDKTVKGQGCDATILSFAGTFGMYKCNRVGSEGCRLRDLRDSCGVTGAAVLKGNCVVNQLTNATDLVTPADVVQGATPGQRSIGETIIKVATQD